jgi:hypothetical protein
MLELDSSSLWATLGLLLALGFRHGLDPDHIAAVDALTRMRFHAQNYWTSRLTGFQFALGHSLTVFLATLILYWQGMTLPTWLDDLGLWVSSGFLLILGLINLRHCVGSRWSKHLSFTANEHLPAHAHFATGTSHHGPQGLIQPLIMKIMGPLAHPMGVGFAFALSLDTLAQAALMAAKGHELGGFALIVVFAMSFGTGMLLADSLNGLVVHWMVRQSEQLAHHTTRVMSGLIATLSLTIVFFSVNKVLYGTLSTWWERWGMWSALALPAFFLIWLAVQNFFQDYAKRDHEAHVHLS